SLQGLKGVGAVLQVSLGVPKDHSSLINAPELDYSSFYVTTGTGNTGCLVAQDLALLAKVRTRIHEEISLLTVLYFPFRARTPTYSSPDVLGLLNEAATRSP